jgi:hypothetical protein
MSTVEVSWLQGVFVAAANTHENEKRVEGYRTDPVAWAKDTLGAHLWSKQREILEAVQEHPKVAVKAGHGVGKTFNASVLGSWWVSTHPAAETRLVTTAPTWEQVQGVMWRELSVIHSRNGLVGNITGDCRWRIDGLIVGQGRKPSDYNASAFQGVHAPYVLVVIDEACGVSDVLFEGAANIVTGPECRTLAIGNPDDPNSTFARLCEGSPTDGSSGMSNAGWYVINISVFDSPRFSGEDVPQHVYDQMPGETWLEAKRLEVGEDSPLWISKVLGQFPEDASDGVVPSSWVANCRRLDRDWTPERLARVELGVDVGASDNGDQTVVWERCGPKLGRRWAIREKDHVKLAAWLVNIIQKTGAQAVKMDSTGVGHGLVNLVTAYGAQGHHAAKVFGVNFGSAARDAKKYRNARAEMFWMVRRLVQEQAVDFANITDAAVAELTVPTYELDLTGRVLVSPKVKVKEKLGRSPDDADAIMLAYYTPPVVSNGAAMS